jgi:hypothetical protein
MKQPFMADLDPTYGKQAPQKGQGKSSVPIELDPTMNRPDPKVLGIAPQDSFGTKARSFVTGKGRTEYPKMDEVTAAPEFAPKSAEAFKVAGGLLASSTPDQEVDIIRKSIPEAQFRQDSYGNNIVGLPSGEYYLNKPGLSGQDVLKAGAQGVAYVGAARAGGAPASGPLTRALGVGAGSGVASMGLDLAAQGAGSNQGIDLPRAGVAAGTGALAEMAAPIFSSLWRYLSKGGKTPTVEAARSALKGLGYEEGDLTDAAVEAYIKQASVAADPAAAAKVAEAQTLPVPVPQTRGQLSMNPRDQMFEDLASKGSYGDFAQKAVSGIDDAQQAAIRGNVPAIQSNLSGGTQQVVEYGQGGTAAQQALSAKNKAMGDAVSGAYDSAREITTNIPGKAAGGIVSDIEANVKDFLPNAKMASRKLRELKGILRPKEPETGGLVDQYGKAINPAPDSVETAKIFQWRREVTTLAQSASDRTERTALGNMVKQLDDSIEKSIKDNLMAGSEEEASRWMKAIALRREQGRVFGAGDLVSDLIEKDMGKLSVAPEAATNYIFGASNTGIINRPQLARELKKVRSILGKDSAEWNALREEAFIKFAEQGEGAMVGGSRQFSGANFKKSWELAQRKNPEVMRTLFNPEELKTINQFANVAARTTNPVKGGANFSNTTPALARLGQSLMGPIFNGSVKVQTLMASVFPGIVGGAQGIRTAVRAGAGIPLRQIPTGIVGGAGTTIGSQLNQ